MERTILHVAIDSFPIEAERLRCPKLVGRPVALAPQDSPRPRIAVASSEARAAGIEPGTPAIVARRLCPDLVMLPPDRDFYAGIGRSIFERLVPFAPLVETGVSGRFFLDLTGVARTHPEARDRAARAGREVLDATGLRPALGVASNKLVSRVAAERVVPGGDLLDVSAGSEVPFLAPLPVSVLPSARGSQISPRLDLLHVRFVRDVQTLSVPQLGRVLGRAGLLVWRQAHGVDPSPVRPPDASPRVVAQETLSRETNDGRILGAHAERLAAELGAGLRLRGESVRWLAVRIEYADGREDRAQRSFAGGVRHDAELRAAARVLLERAARRRVRVRNVRLAAWGVVTGAEQLALWDAEEPDAPALESALDRIRVRFGSEALHPASWMLYGLTLRAPARP